MEYTSSEHCATLSVACPHCKAKVGKPCIPKHARWKYRPPEAAWYTHEARHVAYKLWVAAQPVGDVVIVLNYANPSYGTDPVLVKDVKADVRGVLAILGKYGNASAA